MGLLAHRKIRLWGLKVTLFVASGRTSLAGAPIPPSSPGPARHQSDGAPLGPSPLASSVHSGDQDRQDRRESSPSFTVDVMGRYREIVRPRRTGQSLYLRPTDASRFESLPHLQRETSVQAPETGRISPSGFVLPKIRGQDVRLTDVYIDNIQVQDPYSGLPLIEDLDLRAFGTLEIHQGLPPVDLPGFNPVGALRYRFRPETQSSQSGGLQMGDPYGHSLWGLTVTQDRDEETADPPHPHRSVRLYLRTHQTSGRYPYYNDQGTPYTTADDHRAIRTNNDQRSQQLVPYVTVPVGPYLFSTLGWGYRAERGLPTLSATLPSASREQAGGGLWHARVVRRISGQGQASDPGGVARDQRIDLGLGVTGSSDERRVHDPGRRFLGTAERSTFRVWSRRGQLTLSGHGGSFGSHLTVDRSQSFVRNHLDQRLAVDLTREATQSTLGLTWSPFALVTLEGKGAYRTQTDRQTPSVPSDPPDPPDPPSVALEWNVPEDPAGEAQANHTEKAQMAGASLALGDQDWGTYAQLAHSERLPTLIEQFGDGGALRPSAQLRPETMRHLEWGAFVRGPMEAWHLGLSLYRDETLDRITFVPVLANASKAQNIRQTSIIGQDLRLEWGWAATRLYASGSRVLAFDRTRNQAKRLPGIPEYAAALEVEQGLGHHVKARWLSRYRSDVFRDLANSVRLPGALLHDISLDLNRRLSYGEIQTAIVLKNVTDLRSRPVEAPGSPESRGRTAYSDIDGAPLPGRHWVLSVVLKHGP